MRIDDVNYHVRVAGQGTPVLLLHGFTGSGENWTELIDSLRSDCELIAVDLLGHGLTDSPADPQRYAIARAASDLEQILETLEVGACHVVGYSMGGRLALYFALTCPDRIASLCLESASPGIQDAAEAAARRQSDDALAERIQSDGLEAFVTEWERLPLFATQDMLPDSLRQRLREQRLCSDPTGLANSLRGMGAGQQPSLWERLGELEMPVRLITGALDPKYVSIAQRMSGNIAHVAHDVVADAGHTVHLEQPQVFENLLRDHLRQFSG